jgi:hypothetical protein
MATSPTKQGKTERIHAAVLPEVKDRFNALCAAYMQSGGGLLAMLIDAEYKAHEERERRRKDPSRGVVVGHG